MTVNEQTVTHRLKNHFPREAGLGSSPLILRDDGAKFICGRPCPS